jgi:3-methyladenine DNA glycosylase/8-oxoguanine DNA glycosylase
MARRSAAPPPDRPHAAAEAALAALDPALGAVIARVGTCGLEVAEGGTLFEHLARAITFQQLSGKAAATIFGRFEALFAPGRPTPEGLAGLTDEALRAAGLSRQKVASLRSLAAHLAGRDLALEALAGWDDAAILADLTQVRGIGRWTVEMLMLFRLGRPDVLAADDLGIQRGIEVLYGLPARPKPREVAAYGERWKPYRSVASWYLWRASEGL